MGLFLALLLALKGALGERFPFACSLGSTDGAALLYHALKDVHAGLDSLQAKSYVPSVPQGLFL